jgi:hypothetical protein
LLPGVHPADYLAGVRDDGLQAEPRSLVVYVLIKGIEALRCLLSCQYIAVPPLRRANLP